VQDILDRHLGMFDQIWDRAAYVDFVMQDLDTVIEVGRAVTARLLKTLTTTGISGLAVPLPKDGTAKRMRRWCYRYTDHDREYRSSTRSFRSIRTTGGFKSCKG
jgi:hypothetical protein